MLNHLVEMVRLPDGSGESASAASEWANRALELHGTGNLREFRLDMGLPVSGAHEFGGFVLEKPRAARIHRQNTVHITYRLTEGDAPVRLKLQPSLHFRPHDDPVSMKLPGPHVLTAVDDRYLQDLGRRPLPPLRLLLHGQKAAFTLESKRSPEILYRVEESRGYDSKGELWSPGYFRIDLARGQDATLVASTEQWETVQALSPAEAEQAERLRVNHLLTQAPEEAREGLAGELVLAADQFIIAPAGRVEDAARARAAGDEVRTVIAGYHWFTDWGRDTVDQPRGLDFLGNLVAAARPSSSSGPSPTTSATA